MDYQNPQTASQPRQQTPQPRPQRPNLNTAGIFRFARQNRRPITIVVAALLIFFAASALYNNFFGQTRTITVTGVGRKTAQPEKAILSFSYVYESTNESQAISQGEQQFNEIISAATSFQPDKIDKNSYQLVDNSRNSLTSGALTRASSFQYVNAAQLTTTNLESVDDIIAALYEAGATQVTQVRYLPENEEKFTQELRQLAVRDAKAKARKLTRASGSWLGGVLNIQEAGSTGETGTSVNTLANTEDGGYDLDNVGEIELESAVIVTFQIR